jgi:hypothetical protein
MNWLEIESKWREMACRAQGIKPPASQAMPFDTPECDTAVGSVGLTAAARVDVTHPSVAPNPTTL